MAITIDGSSGITFPDSSVLASGNVGTSWQSVKTANFTAVAGEGYPINTTSGSVTVTMPSSPSAGDTVEFIDYAETFGDNAVVLTSSDNINSSSNNSNLSDSKGYYAATYIDATIGWRVTKQGENFSAYPVDFLIIAGGGGTFNAYSDFIAGGGAGAGGYLASYNSESSGDSSASLASLQLKKGTEYTVTVGAGGAGYQAGSDSDINISTVPLITAIGGGWTFNTTQPTGGSGGGGTASGEGALARAPGSGTIYQGGDGGIGVYTNGTTTAGGGGGGASGDGGDASGTVAGNGANGLASTITGSSVTRGGGGGGGSNSGTAGTGGTGGGGNGANGAYVGSNGTANTGGGAGGSGHRAGGAQGGSGVVILRMATANYSGTTTGSPTVTTDGSDTILTFNATGSYTA